MVPVFSRIFQYLQYWYYQYFPESSGIYNTHILAMTSSTIFGDVNVKNIFTSHIDKKIIDIFNIFIFIHFHYMKMHRL
jgi:hypothetical protein